MAASAPGARWRHVDARFILVGALCCLQGDRAALETAAFSQCVHSAAAGSAPGDWPGIPGRTCLPILTHSIDLKESRQRSKPVHIGHHCFVGTGCVLLSESALPDCSVLGAHSLLASRLETPGYLYAGNPAKPIKPVEPDAKYFSRDTGYVL